MVLFVVVEKIQKPMCLLLSVRYDTYLNTKRVVIFDNNQP